MAIFEGKKNSLFDVPPLLKYHFWARQLYCILGIMPFFSIFYHRDLAFHFYFIFFLQMAIWPLIAYLIAYISKNPKKTEIQFNMHFEVLFLGIWVPICWFNPSICFYLLIGSSVSGIMAGGGTLLLTRTTALISGCILGSMIFGLHFSSLSTLATIIWADIGILGGTIFLSFLFARTNKMIILTRKKLKEQKASLDKELEEAASYVKTMLPQPISEGSIQIDWRFFPSASLGGDAFGYQWLDDDHFAIYLLDVSGHGVGAALLSVSIQNVLRSQSLPETDFKRADQVLERLNMTFQGERHNDMFFTIWYGVYDKSTRKLTYASGGHPPALLFGGNADGNPKATLLRTPCYVIGGMPDVTYEKRECTVGEIDKLYIFSDGVYEVEKSDGSMWRFKEFTEFMTKNRTDGKSALDQLYRYANNLNKSDEFEDDFTIVEVSFG